MSSPENNPHSSPRSTAEQAEALTSPNEPEVDSYGWTQDNLPPLGPLIDFQKIDQERADSDARLEHTSLEVYPELVASFDTITQNLNRIRTQVGAPEITLDMSVVRLMDQAQWNALRGGASQPDSNAFYAPLSGNVYMLFDEERYKASKVNQMFQVYTLAHELSHKATHGVEGYSFHLSEGLADFLAQESLENGGLAPIVTEEELAYRERYLKMGPVEWDGFTLEAKDLFVLPNEAGSAYGYIPQLRLIQTMQTEMGEEQFDEFLHAAFTGNNSVIKNIITAKFGKNLAFLLDDVRGTVSPHALLKIIH